MLPKRKYASELQFLVCLPSSLISQHKHVKELSQTSLCCDEAYFIEQLSEEEQYWAILLPGCPSMSAVMPQQVSA
jgi:hypothetical protein